MASEKIWRQWLERLYNLRRDKSGSNERPHKPVLLLAILDLLDRGILAKNEIRLTPDLISTFNRYFDAVRQRNDQPSIQNPFYHLCGDGFWHLSQRLANDRFMSRATSPAPQPSKSFATSTLALTMTSGQASSPTRTPASTCARH